MPYTLSTILAPQAVITASGTGTAVTSTYGLARVSLSVEATVGGSVTFYLEGSKDGGTTWATLYTSTPLTGASQVEATVPGLPQKIRLRWAFATLTTSATFGAVAELVQTYASPVELYRHACPSAALSGISATDIAEELVTSSDVADGYLGSRYTLPLKTWGSDLTRAVAHITEYSLLTNRGLQAEGQDWTIILHKYEAAMVFLSDIAKGRVNSPHITDSAVLSTASSGRAYVVTTPLRGW